MNHLRAKCFIVLLVTAVSCASCTGGGIRLSKSGDQGGEIKGDFRVIFFGCNYFNDLETIAFLDKEDDKYTFEPYAPDFKYRIEDRIDVKDAFEKVQKFMNCNSSFLRSRISAVKAPNGVIIGYEIRPLYEALTYGIDDVLYTDYWLKDDKVVIIIRLNPSIERMHQGGVVWETLK